MVHIVIRSTNHEILNPLFKVGRIVRPIIILTPYILVGGGGFQSIVTINLLQ